jgi:hypothetical protein
VILNSIIDADGGWITTNDLTAIAYPELAAWRGHERARFAVRKAVFALKRDPVQAQGVVIFVEGEGSAERVRGDLRRWTRKKIKEPRHRDRAKPEPIEIEPVHTKRGRPPKGRCKCGQPAGFIDTKINKPVCVDHVDWEHARIIPQ